MSRRSISANLLRRLDRIIDYRTVLWVCSKQASNLGENRRMSAPGKLKDGPVCERADDRGSLDNGEDGGSSVVVVVNLLSHY